MSYPTTLDSVAEYLVTLYPNTFLPATTSVTGLAAVNQARAVRISLRLYTACPVG